MRSDRAPVSTFRPERAEVAAEEHLRFIRDVMARSGAFTAVPGWGAVAMGATAVVAAVFAEMQATETAWLRVWLVEALVAAAIGAGMLVRKSQRSGIPLSSGAGRKYMLSLVPPLAAGALLTAALWRAGAVEVLPGLWLLLYGAGTVTGGVFSVRIIPLMGLAFMALGAAALLCPFEWANLLLGAGFGGIHILFGILIVRHHGG